MGTERIIKNHMDILWHEYTDAGGEEQAGYRSKPDGKGIHCRAGRYHASFLWYGSVESEKFYEYIIRSHGDHLHCRYRSDVDRIYLF